MFMETQAPRVSWPYFEHDRHLVQLGRSEDYTVAKHEAAHTVAIGQGVVEHSHTQEISNTR